MICFCTASAGHAVVLNDDYFAASGGDPTDAITVAATLDAGYSAARAESFTETYLAVGSISGCTATWIGNDEGTGNAYFLTAAHCIETGTEAFSLTMSFTDWNGRVILAGTGTGYVPPERVNIPAGFGGASTDIAIIELPGQAEILDTSENSIQRPLLYDGSSELGIEVTFAGYGSWGVGSMGSDGGLFPTIGPRRAAGHNIINRLIEMDHALGYTMDAPGTGDAIPLESAGAPGDSGSAWWQEQDGLSTIVGTTCCGTGNSYGTVSYATRVSKYIDWIRSIYSVAQLHSEAGHGINADINHDGLVSGDGTGPWATDDVTAFIAEWRRISYPNGPNPADLNQSGLVNLSDWWYLARAINDAGGGYPEFPVHLLVPEPGTNLLTVLLLLGVVAWGIRGNEGIRGSTLDT